MNFPDLCCNIHKLKVREIGLEKFQNDFLLITKNNYGMALENENNKIKTIREQELQNLCKDVRKSMHNLKQIKSDISQSNLANIDITSLKNNMMSLSNSIKDLKNRVAKVLESLSSSEIELTIDVTNIEMKLMDKDEFDVNKISKYSTKFISNDRQLYEEVKEFLTFLNETGGHDGGWAHEDHLLFLRLYNKIKNKKKLFTSLQTLFVDKDEEIISNHYDWYKTYLKLRNRQREAIEKWRENKNKMNNIETNKKQNEHKRETVKHENSEELRKLKEKIENWKLEKQEKIKQNIEKQIENINRTKQIENQKVQKNQQKKLEILHWKLLKQTKEKTDNMEKELMTLKEKQRKIQLANRLIREFQHQDNIYISKRLKQFKINIVPPNTMRNTKKMKQSKVRDPDRVMKVTRQWTARISNNEEDVVQDKHLSIKNIPKLAVPSWRKCIP